MIGKILDFVFVRIPLKFKKKIVSDVFNKSERYSKRALLYYKTDYLFSKRLLKNSPHTNNQEIIEMVSALNDLKFIVDLVDRSASLKDMETLKGFYYDLIISNCGGNSSPLHNEILHSFQYKHVLAYAMGPDPVLSAQLTKKRHLEFAQRTGVNPIVRRLVNGSVSDLESRFKKSSGIIVNGKPFSFDSYLKYNKPIYYVPPIINERIIFNKKIINRKSFLYFGGNGLIHKGLDIVLEAFEGLSDFDLHICGPNTEEDFWNYYQPLVGRNSNIKYYGFVRVGSDQFYNIMDKVTFNIFVSASEGAATSVLTAMRMGVIPVINYEAGVSIDGFGFAVSEMQSNPIELKKLLISLSKVSIKDLEKKSMLTHKKSLEFCTENFVSCFKNAIKQATGEK